ncbi:MAG: NAD(P)H-dependent oxidoreductase, partial [Pseudomonadota bacterium]
KYTENGPVGLLEDKTAYLVVASGGTASGSEIDFATGYMKHVLGFVGITNVHVVDASKQGAGAEGAIARARAALPKAVAA